MLRTGDDGLEEWNQGGMSEMDEFHMGSEMDEFHIGFGITLYLSPDHVVSESGHWREKASAVEAGALEH